MMILYRSIKNQKDFFFHWKIMVPLFVLIWWVFNFELKFLLLVAPAILGVDLFPGLWLIYAFKRDSPFEQISIVNNEIQLCDSDGNKLQVVHISQIKKMIGYKNGGHPSRGTWSPFVACSFGFQHVEIELNDGRVLNITSLYDENIDSIIKQIKPEVYEEKMGLPYIRRKNTFP